MSRLLRGNFEPKTDVQETRNERGDDLESQFERAALARLGGSIGYVSRKKFLWDGEGEEKKEVPATGRAGQYDKD
jgi:hypothetical protein